jgi:hypothetical protein
MTLDDAIRDFTTSGPTLPRASMRWALDNWEEAASCFVRLLDDYASGVGRSEEAMQALFFIIHLLGEKREATAFRPLCRLLHDAEATEDILGDATTETLRDVLISTFDDDPSSLMAVIEDPEADQFVREAALIAMAYLTRSGGIPDADMRRYLLHLRMEMRPQAESQVWVGWVTAVAHLGYVDYVSEVKQLFRRGFVGRWVMRIDHFHGDLRRTLDDPEGMAGFAHDQVAPFADPIGTLSTWYAFSEQRRHEDARWAADRASRERLEVDDGDTLVIDDDEPHINPLRHVGRNDPCPCGSGKKFKKCCLQ